MINETVLEVYRLHSQWSMDNPFIFCAHHQDAYPRGNNELGPAVSLSGRNLGNDFSGKDGFSMYHGDKVPGFPAHPHRGFETITIVLKGLIDHFDSKGNEGRYGNGDVQWLTAGAGCQHNEMFPLVEEDNENPLELFQIWLNLPARDKFAKPDYKMMWAEDIPEFQITGSNEKKSAVRLIAGTFNDHKSQRPCPDSYASNEQNHVGIFMVQMEPQATLTLPAISETLIRNLYFYRGNDLIQIGTKKIGSSSRARLSGNTETLIINGKSISNMIILEGEPINEPVEQYGPFVMNTHKEIREAIDDYQKTAFGGWPWNNVDQVHDRKTGRFAKYADGKTENR